MEAKLLRIGDETGVGVKTPVADIKLTTELKPAAQDTAAKETGSYAQENVDKIWEKKP